LEQIDPWDRIQDDAFELHKSRFHDLVNEYEQNEDSSEFARIKADNALLKSSGECSWNTSSGCMQ